MNIKNLNDNKIMEDNVLRLLLSSGINLEYYDHVIWSKEYLEKVIQTNSFEFWYSGLTVTLSNGIKRTLLFIWEKFYDLPSATSKMNEILKNLSEDMLNDMSERSLKQSLKPIRKTNINLI
jgi:hypothetical protein